jgi:hypothetical protein
MATTAFKSAAHAKSDPFLVLAQNILCAPPPTNLTPNQTFALHEFFHEVAAAGFKLYQIVPPDAALPIIKDKLAAMLDPTTAKNEVPIK